ncbi:MAG: pyrroline-5-carboxylate reductase [Gammaproteobacteria bacterium]|nr:pyrroline-5-carboxylate reductase [Gammaproteobacteria bacterium]
MSTRIAFIGGGNMATSLVGGLVTAGTTPSSILVAEPDAERRSFLSRQFGIATTGSNLETLQQDVVVLSIKPQMMQAVCRQLATSTNSGAPLYVSIAAGIRTNDVARWLGGTANIVRCMPNTPALIRCGATALYANQSVNDAQRQLADTILGAAGITAWVENEDLLDVATAVSGSGPAYYFLLMEAMQAAAVSLGLDPETAGRLITQTALGAARMANESEIDVAELRARVTSSGGTTAAAISSFEDNGFHINVGKAINAAYDRSRELADELGKDK